MHWTKEIVKNLIEDVDGGDFFFGLSMALLLGCLLFGGGIALYYNQVNLVRTDYKEVMEKHCAELPDGDVCSYAAKAYFEVKDQGLLASPLFWVALVFLVEALVVAALW